MSTDKPVRPLLIAICAALLVLVLNVVLRLVLKLDGMPASIGIAFGVGGLVAFWFASTRKRVPTSQERFRILLWYAGLISVPMLLLFLAGAASKGFNPYALFIISLHLLAYPAAAQFFLSEKRMQSFLTKRT